MQSSRSTFRPPGSWRDRFFAGYSWLILRNILGWSLLLVSFVAGPLVPGPGGLPLFLIGFALVSLPGKRRLTVRVLRGKPIRFRTKWFSRITLAVALAASVLVLPLTRPWARWPVDQPVVQFFMIIATYLGGIAGVWLAIRVMLYLVNALLRIAPRARRHIRPWLRRRHIRLLPPRWRRRLPHERGSGPHRMKDEILKLGPRA